MTHHKMSHKKQRERVDSLIRVITLAKTEALALGLHYTFRGLDRAEKAVGYELSAILEAESGGQNRFWKSQIALAAAAVLDQVG